MGMQLPGELVFAMSLVGFDWPLADEEKLAESAELWRVFAEDFRERAVEAGVGAREVVGLNEGATIDAFAGYWAVYAGEGGRLEAAAGEAELIGSVLDAAAGIVLALKLAVIAQLVWLATQIAIGIAAAAPTGGASLAASAIAAATTKITVKILLDQAKRALLDLAQRELKDAADRITRMIADAKPPGKPDTTPGGTGPGAPGTPGAAGTPRDPNGPDGHGRPLDGVPDPPDFSSPTIDADGKLTGYALNPDHPVGGHKARVIHSATGLDASDVALVEEQIREGVQRNVPQPGRINEFGQRWTVDLPLSGPSGTIVVRTGWILDPGSTTPRLITLYPAK